MKLIPFDLKLFSKVHGNFKWVHIPVLLFSIRIRFSQFWMYLQKFPHSFHLIYVVVPSFFVASNT